MDTERVKSSFALTLEHMEYRKSIRKYRGSYHPTNSGVTLFLVFLLLLFWGFQEFFSTDYSLGLRLEWYSNNNSEVKDFNEVLIGFILAAILLLLLIAAQVRYNVSEAIYIVSTFLVAMFLVIVLVDTSSRAQVQYILFTIYVCLQICVLIVYFIRRNYIPKIIKRNWIIARARIKRGYPTIEEILCGEQKKNAKIYKVDFKYTGPLQSWFGIFGRVDRVTYIGSLNDEMQAHGYGEWKDNAWHGEQLHGMWRNGKPVAPFNSRETGSGSGFVSMRIAFWTTRQDEFKQVSWLPRFKKGAVGVGSSEACVYGVFFKDYPQVELLTGPTPYSEGTSNDGGLIFVHELLSQANNLNTSPFVFNQQKSHQIQRWQTGHIRWSLKYLDRFDFDEHDKMREQETESVTHSVTVTANKEKGLVVSGYNPKEKFSPCDNITIKFIRPTAISENKLQQEGQSSTKNGTQETICINQDCTFDDEQSRLFIEGWSPKTQQGNQDVIVFIHGFNCALSDSLRILGQFLALANFNSEVKSIVFSWPAVRDIMYLQAKSASECFECSLQFLDMLNALYRDGYRSVHILTHSMGVRVLMAAIPFLETAIHGHCHPSDNNEKLLEALDNLQHLDISLETITLLNPDYSLEEFVNGKGQRLRRLCPIITIYGDKSDGALYYSSVANAIHKKISKVPRLPVGTIRNSREQLQNHPKFLALRLDLMLGKELDLIMEPCENQDQQDNIKENYESSSYLDVDVVDTTFMEANVHAMRHNYFNLNRELVEDIRDLITTNRRAAQRSHRLENKEGNIFQFLVAPSYVQNP